MDKEMKKLLLVAVSVGVFLLVTITIAIIVLTPKTSAQDIAYSSSIPYSNRNGRTQPAPEILPPQPAVISNTQEPIIAIAEEITRTADSNNGDSLTIQIPRPATAAVDTSQRTSLNGTTSTTAGSSSVTTVRPAASPSQPAATVRQPSAQTQSVSPSSSTAAAPSTQSPAASRPSSSRQNTAPRPAPARVINDYWVQTGAFSSMVRAEDAKEVLAAKGLTSIIDSRIVNGQNFYRVRLGPYTTQNEANHWLDIVKVIDGFHGSQVRQTVRGQ